jgi:predicted dehydrogenase
MRDAAVAAGVRTQVGFNYLCSPMIGLARDLIASGELGRIVRFAGTFDEDYMADPAAPFSWRNLRAEAGAGGALGDLGSHAIAMALYLVGPIASLTADVATVVAERPDASGALRASENDDAAHMLVRFAGGAVGTIATSWSVHGRKNHLAFEIAGTKGTLAFDQERFNELQLFAPEGAKGRRGYRTILAGAEHPDYAAFCPAPGHGLGFNDLKVVEVKRLLEAIASGRDTAVDFRFGARVQAVADAAIESAARRAWVSPRA